MMKRSEGDGYLYSISDELPWSRQFYRLAMKSQSPLRLWDFDHLGFYRPMDDPSAHVYTFQGVSLPGSRLEKLHHVFARSFEKAGAEIQTCLEKERKVHGPLSWETTSSRSTSRNVDSLLQRSVPLTPGVGVSGKKDTSTPTKPDLEEKSSVSEDVQRDKTVAEGPLMGEKSCKEDERKDFVHENDGQVEDITRNEVERLQQKSDPAIEMQSDDAKGEPHDVDVEGETTGIRTECVQCEDKGRKENDEQEIVVQTEVESDELGRMVVEEHEELLTHETGTEAIRMPNTSNDLEGEEFSQEEPLAVVAVEENEEEKVEKGEKGEKGEKVDSVPERDEINSKLDEEGEEMLLADERDEIDESEGENIGSDDEETGVGEGDTSQEDKTSSTDDLRLSDSPTSHDDSQSKKKQGRRRKRNRKGRKH